MLKHCNKTASTFSKLLRCGMDMDPMKGLSARSHRYEYWHWSRRWCAYWCTAKRKRLNPLHSSAHLSGGRVWYGLFHYRGEDIAFHSYHPPTNRRPSNTPPPPYRLRLSRLCYPRTAAGKEQDSLSERRKSLMLAPSASVMLGCRQSALRDGKIKKNKKIAIKYVWTRG